MYVYLEIVQFIACFQVIYTVNLEKHIFIILFYPIITNYKFLTKVFCIKISTLVLKETMETKNRTRNAPFKEKRNLP